MSDIALFLDLDNFTIGARHAGLNLDVDLLLTYVEQQLEGRVVLRRAYGDSRQNNTLLRQLATAGFVIQAAIDVSGYGKNLADMQIVVDAMETMMTGQQYDKYVLITGDRDFTPLVQCLRQHGKYVVGIGIKHTASYSLANLCDRYLYYKDIAFLGRRSESDVRGLLTHALNELFSSGQERIQASVVKQRMTDLDDNKFDHSQYTDGNFSQFLKEYPDLVEIYHEDTTTYVRRPQKSYNRTALYQKYRTGLKKLRLRVVLPSNVRISLIKDMIRLLEHDGEMQWRVLLESLFDLYSNQKMIDVSKNAINDILLLNRKAQVIRTLKGDSLATAPVKMHLRSEKLFRDSIIQCDMTYLQAIQSLGMSFNLEEAALALYDSHNYVPYLQVVWHKGPNSDGLVV